MCNCNSQHRQNRPIEGMRPPGAWLLPCILLLLLLPTSLPQGPRGGRATVNIREYDYDGDYRPEGVQRMREIFFVGSSSDDTEPLDMIVPQISGHVTRRHSLRPLLCICCLATAMVLHGILGY
ncbi:hypothetical protein XENTR_v10017470 [Xenopus tropicalis]|nr:hypothetical protein XENTR_v10017470 [Xenopus tropicalis]